MPKRPILALCGRDQTQFRSAEYSERRKIQRKKRTAVKTIESSKIVGVAIAIFCNRK